MTDYLGALGILFFMFFLVAAATEAILEALRGGLEKVGITWLKSAVSLDAAIGLATEYLPDGSRTLGKVAALQEMVKKGPKTVAAKLEELQEVHEALAALPLGSKIDNMLMTKVNIVAMHIRDAFDADERNRVFYLRTLSAIIAIALSAIAQIDALQATVQAYPKLFHGVLSRIYVLEGSGPDAIVVAKNFWGKAGGIMLTGIAAASGSSYWHDALDKVRNLKNVAEKVQKAI